ncbi:hypothetical protein C5167_032140 [Papaver somniferum]|uniref:Uncharacterized protein n=1 Tax=Papaver somniferum TaxID=3469 RepID=A0A4Y7K9Z8_PAPSO|nr:hypothetical protein C5167_032140 [Papaver somniferum]
MPTESSHVLTTNNIFPTSIIIYRLLLPSSFFPKSLIFSRFNKIYPASRVSIFFLQGFSFLDITWNFNLRSSEINKIWLVFNNHKTRKSVKCN